VGLPDLHFHDLRRTFATDAADAGAEYAAIMEWTGHKTMSMLQRYNIKNLKAMQRVAARVETFRQAETSTPPPSNVVPLRAEGGRA
jgi:integrase